MGTKKSTDQILRKLRITHLNEMQKEASLAITSSDEVIILSPTGSGKTLAFLLPLISGIDTHNNGVQAIIIVPSRELAIQIEQVARDMGSGIKVNAVYGGRAIAKDYADLQHTPTLLIGTPGRIADHLRRDSIAINHLKYLVLDEFDKCLEIGFEEQMIEIIESLPKPEKKILTSATQAIEVPSFVGLQKSIIVDYLQQGMPQLVIKRIISPDKDKLDTLVRALRHIGNQPGLVFLNYKDAILRVSDHLDDLGISHACFHSGLDQHDRERALIKFRNGSHQLLITSDLAARGLDIPEIRYIIHYHLPHREEEYTHRNGRTARMHKDGVAYVLQYAEEPLPEYMGDLSEQELTNDHILSPSPWKTLFISGGRKDKISKGDIAGLLMKRGQLDASEVGIIELKSDCAFVAVAADHIYDVIRKIDNARIKKRKVRVYPV